MKVEFEVSPRLIVMTALCGFVGLMALAAAFPDSYVLWPKNSADWATWVQAVGSIAAIATAIAIPWSERRSSKQEAIEKAAADADIVLRFYLELFETNDSLLRVAAAHLPGGRHEKSGDALSQVLASVRALRSLPFEQVQTIGIHNAELAGDLSDFHCERVKLIGILDRNPGTNLRTLQRTLAGYVGRLESIRDRIMGSSAIP